MKTQVYASDMIGKTIKTIVTSLCGSALIVFTDETFAYLDIEPYREDSEIRFSTKLTVGMIESSVLIETNIATQKEINDEHLRRTIEQEAQRMSWTRAEYERIKKEFGI